MDPKKVRTLKIVIAFVIVAALVALFATGVIKIGNNGKIVANTVNTVNTAGTPEGPANTAAPANTAGNDSPNSSNTAPEQLNPGGTGKNGQNEINGNAADPVGNASEGINPSGNTAENQGPVYYTSEDLKNLTGTEIFNSTAIEHIFMGSVNSKKKGSGYHYDMIEDSPGQIVEGTRSKADENGIYTANVEVDGYAKSNFSSFYPDEWTPQQVVDAIAEARKEALKTGEMRGNYHVGHSNGIRIEMYLDSKDKVVTAYPVKNGK